jgi:hypothetical protein
MKYYFSYFILYQGGEKGKGKKGKGRSNLRHA